jgi:hypothetical protein
MQKLTADQFAESLRPLVEQARGQGITSRHALADYLTERGIRTAMGKRIWDHDGAGRLLARLKKRDVPDAPVSPARSPAHLAGGAARADEARAFAETMRDHLLAGVESGANTDLEITAVFNRLWLRTRNGDRWNRSAVTALRVRLGVKPFWG